MIQCDECGTRFEPMTDAYKCPDCGAENGPMDDEQVFTNCNVCGRALRFAAEDRMGMCFNCSAE